MGFLSLENFPISIGKKKRPLKTHFLCFKKFIRSSFFSGDLFGFSSNDNFEHLSIPTFFLSVCQKSLRGLRFVMCYFVFMDFCGNSLLLSFSQN